MFCSIFAHSEKIENVRKKDNFRSYPIKQLDVIEQWMYDKNYIQSKLFKGKSIYFCWRNSKRVFVVLGAAREFSLAYFISILICEKVKVHGF